MQMDEDLTFCQFFGVESSSSKHAQGGPGMFAKRDIQEKSYVLFEKKSKIFPPAAGVLLLDIVVEPGGPRGTKFKNTQDKRGYPQYCLASKTSYRPKLIGETSRTAVVDKRTYKKKQYFINNYPRKGARVMFCEILARSNKIIKNHQGSYQQSLKW
jgi:hypothetical protein